MGYHPLDPYTVILLLEVELLKSLRIEMLDIFILQDLFSFFNILLALIDQVNFLIDLTEKLLGDSANASPTVNYSISGMFWVGFEVRENKFEGSSNISGT